MENKILNLVIGDGDTLNVGVVRQNEMTLEMFWRVVAEYGPSFPDTPLTKREIVEFDYLFTLLDDYAQSVLKPYGSKHWWLSDDGFRCCIWWIISQGRDFYNNALVHPENLGDDISPAEVSNKGETFRYAIKKALEQE